VLKESDPDEIISPNDKEVFIRINTKENTYQKNPGNRFKETLDSLGLSVSTGKVVDFRANGFIVTSEHPESVPLIYPSNLRGGNVKWPVSKKAKAILNLPKTQELLVPSKCYVLVKRFSSKEERKRVVAALYDPSQFSVEKVGFENHVNYFHKNQGGLDFVIAKGLTAFLNSDLIDSSFRDFSGHTQVNATDLRSLMYPTIKQLKLLGEKIGKEFPEQESLNSLVNELLN